MSKYALILVILLACCLCQACIPPKMPKNCGDFFALPGSQRDKLFPTYSLDEQLALYRCGMSRRPPETALALYIADKGSEAIPNLLDKLESEKEEVHQMAIVEVFQLMAIKGHMRGRTDAIDRIRRVVTAMKIEVFRDMALKSLKGIEEESSG